MTVRTLALADSSGGPGAAARLHLAELLLLSDEVGECAQHAVDWLGETSGAQWVICLLTEPGARRFTVAASYRIPPTQWGAFEVDLAQAKHPLVAALGESEPSLVSVQSVVKADAAGAHRQLRALGADSLVAAPLPQAETPDAKVGMLLAWPPTPVVLGDLNWLVKPLGRTLARLRDQGAPHKVPASDDGGREMLLGVVNAIPDPILLTDKNHRILLSNAGADALFVSQEGDGEGRRRAVVLNNTRFSAALSEAALAEPGAARRELLILNPDDGSELPFEYLRTELGNFGEGGAVVSVLHSSTGVPGAGNIGELLRHNELLRRQHAALKQASALKTQFVANMSHEFRTPLNAILGYTSLLLQGVSGPLLPPVKRNLSRVDSNAKHLLSIVNNILDIKSVEAGEMPLHLDDFEVPALITEVLAEVEPLIPRGRLSVSSSFDAFLPALHSDRQKVKQIVLNLLSNAIKFTPHGTVLVQARERENEIAISMRDTGIGIARKDQKKIFEDFSQADGSVTRDYGGTGLGLALCRRLAEMLGGRIELKSALGHGATFTLFLPRKEKS